MFGMSLTVYGYTSSSYNTAGTIDRQDCSDIVAGVSDNAAAYSTVELKLLCQTTGPKYTDPILIGACADGAAHKADGIMYCSARYKGSFSAGQGNDGTEQRKACYAGQGNPGGEDCVLHTVGTKKVGYSDLALINACLYGTQHTEAGACDAKYGPAYNGSTLVKRTDELNACTYGQQYPAVPSIENANSEDTGSVKEDVTSCGISGVGWLVCPALGFVASITDTAFSFLATTFLETPASLFASSTDNATYNAWSVMRNIANVAFVIAFLIIIISQLSNVGVTNYGVKKLLPRLVIAAILVNVSYFVCQIAVDLSNILGYGLKALFDNIGGFTQSPSADLTSTGETGNGFGVAAVTTIVLAGGIGLAFAISVPVLLAAVLALLLIVLILFGRTALIVLLVVISPLAFVAYLLPNTEDLFKKWRKLFTTLLVLFPVIAVVFGASNLAAGIINSSASYVGNTDDNSILQIVAIGVAAVPLFAVPALLRGALNGAGAIGTKLSGLSSKASGSIGGKIASTSRAGQYAKYYKGEIDKNRALAQSGSYTGKNPFHRLTSGVNKRINQSKISGKFGQRATAQGSALESAEDAELLKNSDAKVALLTFGEGNDERGLTTPELIQYARGEAVTVGNQTYKASSEHDKRAAMMRAGRVANAVELAQMLDSSVDSSGNSRMSKSERNTLKEAMLQSPGIKNAAWLGGSTLGRLEKEGISSTVATQDKAKAGAITAQMLAGSSKESLEVLNTSIAAMAPGPDRDKAVANLKKSYQELWQGDDTTLRSGITPGGDVDNEMRKILSL